MDNLATDLLQGARAAAEFTFGDAKKQRLIYNMVEQGHVPVVRKGKRLFFRKSDLRRAFSVSA